VTVALRQLRIELGLSRALPRREVADLGPQLQGVLMGTLDPVLASELHQTSINPYSQYVLPGAGLESVTWVLSGMDDAATTGIFAALENLATTGFRLEQRKIDVTPGKVETESIGKKDLDAAFFAIDPPKKFKVKFLTPTAFRQQGEFTFLPEPRLVFQSLAMKYSQLVDGEEPGAELVEEL